MGYNSGFGTGTEKKYKSILLEGELSDSMFSSYGYVDVFYILDDDSKEKIYGSWTVEMDAPIFVRLKKEELAKKEEKEKEKERISLILEKYSNEQLKQDIIKTISRFSRKGYSKQGQFEFSDVKGIMITIGGYKYKKFWDCALEIQLTNNKVINTKISISSLEITKKMLKSMGGKNMVPF